jgi:hypothetical protein
MPDNPEFDMKKSSQTECPIILKLSGRYFNKGLDIESRQWIQNNRIREIYRINIDLEVNPEFLNCDFKENIELYLKENNNIIFIGVIEESFVDGKKATLISQDISFKFNYISIIGLEISDSLRNRDAASLMISPIEELRLGNTSDIPDTTLRDFIVVVPISNLIIKKNCFIGKVEFYNKLDAIDDILINDTNIGKKVLEWKSFQTRARVVINASDFRIALNRGYNEISTAIDLIALRNDLSFPKLRIHGTDKYPHFNYQEFAAKVTIPKWVYCRERYTHLYAIFNILFPKDNKLELDCDPNEYFDLINQIFSKLLREEDKTKEEKRLLMALHWLRRSIQEGDNKDKILDLWTAMEFIISGIKANRLFCNQQIDAVCQLINSNLNTLKLTDGQNEVLFNKIKTLNDAPLNARIDVLKGELEIDLAEGEIDLIKAARNKRNKIIHGEDIEIYDKELNKLRSLIELLLVGKVSLLINQTK